MKPLSSPQLCSHWKELQIEADRKNLIRSTFKRAAGLETTRGKQTLCNTCSRPRCGNTEVIDSSYVVSVPCRSMSQIMSSAVCSLLSIELLLRQLARKFVSFKGRQE
jgi:hypothetical protein